MGEILHLLLNPVEISLQSSSKTLKSDRGEFEIDWAKSKNNIAKNLFALGHETHNTLYYKQ